MPERLSGAAGLRGLGWLERPAHFPWLEADVLRETGWVLGRVWTAGTTVKTFDRDSQVLHVIIGVEGEGTVRVDGAETTLRGRQIGIFDASTEMRLSSATPWARLEWVLEVPVFPLTRLLSAEAPFDVHDMHWEIIASTTNILVAGGEQPDDLPPLDGLAPVLEHLLVAAATDANIEHARARAPEVVPLIGRARELISLNYTDPHYTVRDLQRDLALSKSHMHRLFAEHDTTPRRELEARRVDAALALAASLPGQMMSQAEVAQRAGFLSVDRMTSALARRGASAENTKGEVTAP